MDTKKAEAVMETVEPIGDRILFCKDDAKGETKGGIVLPDSAKTEVLTGRVVEISVKVEQDPMLPIQKYDKVLVNPMRAIPVELDSNNKLFIVPVEDVVAVIHKDKSE